MIIRKDARLHLENGYNLRIDDLRESDSGEYVCEIETFGSPIHISSRLEILGMFIVLSCSWVTISLAKWSHLEFVWG